MENIKAKIGQTYEQTRAEGKYMRSKDTRSRDMRNIRSNDKNRSLLTCMDVCVDTGIIFGTNSCTGRGYMGISLVLTNKIIYEAS